MTYAQNNWREIQLHYAKRAHLIQAATADKWAVDPYAWDGKGMIFMTPIEQNFWSDIRSVGLVMYPQYPAQGFFLDFANPAAKVGVECDGAEFHTDWKRDRERQAVLEGHGWRIYRISGRECNENWDEERDEPRPAGERLCDLIGERHKIKCGVRGKKRGDWISPMEGMEMHMRDLLGRMSSGQSVA
jgi:hypothetical protein